MSAPRGQVTVHLNNERLRVDDYTTETETVQRFRDIKRDLQYAMPFEVTNQFVLECLMDTYALHQEGR